MTSIFLWPVHQRWGDLWQPSALIELQSSFQILFRLCRPKLVAEKFPWKVASTWGDLGDLFSEDWREIPDGNLNILKVLRKQKPEEWDGFLQRKILIQRVFFVGQQTWLNISGCLTCGLTYSLTGSLTGMGIVKALAPQGLRSATSKYQEVFRTRK